MGRDFILPDLGEGLTEAEIVAWLVQPGDEVAIDQPVVELESAKSVVQLPTPFAGVVESLGGETGQVLHAGSVLMTLAPVGAAVTDAAAAPASECRDLDRRAPQATAPVEPVAAEPGVAVPTEAATEESGAVLIGYGTRATTATKRAASARRAVRSAPARRRRLGPRHDRTRSDAPRSGDVAPPSSRRSCAASRASTASTRASSTDPGPDHLVLRRDVESFVRELEAGAPESRAPRGGPRTHCARAGARGRRRCRGIRRPRRAVDAAGDRRVPLDRMGRAAAAHFSRSRREIPEATVWMDVDATPPARRPSAAPGGHGRALRRHRARRPVRGRGPRAASAAELELRRRERRDRRARRA